MRCVQYSACVETNDLAGETLMKPNTVEEKRRLILDLLDKTRRETRSLLSSLDPDRVIHTDERAWRVRDIVGHLGVWNGEAARSIKAYVNGGEYHCIPTDAKYYEYNGPAAFERRTWTMDRVWGEYESAHAELKSLIESFPDGKWDGEMVYPWNERGSVEALVNIMMRHETVDHCELVTKTVS